ncbi:unnamed protein product [Urochloa humidicola]
MIQRSILYGSSHHHSSSPPPHLRIPSAYSSRPRPRFDPQQQVVFSPKKSSPLTSLFRWGTTLFGSMSRLPASPLSLSHSPTPLRVRAASPAALVLAPPPAAQQPPPALPSSASGPSPLSTVASSWRRSCLAPPVNPRAAAPPPPVPAFPLQIRTSMTSKALLQPRIRHTRSSPARISLGPGRFVESAPPLVFEVSLNPGSGY